MIRIHVAIVDSDETYSSRLAGAFNTYYQDKLEVYSFTDKDLALSFLSSNKIDVFLADENLEIDEKQIPANCAFAYLSAMSGVATLNGRSAVGKFQKVDLIYKSILSLFSEVSNYSVSVSGDGSGKSVVSFISFSGGTGCSTVAAAYATRLAKQGKKPVYLNLEKFGGASEFFVGEGNSNMSDIIYSLKSKKNNLALKIESSVKKSATGVYFLDSANLPLDMLELNQDNIFTLLTELCAMSEYDCIVVDFNFTFSEVDMELLKKSDSVVVVSNGTTISNFKTSRCLQSLELLDHQKESLIIPRLKMFYNNFSSVNGQKLTEVGITTIGGAPRYNGTDMQIVESLSSIKDLDNI